MKFDQSCVNRAETVHGTLRLLYFIISPIVWNMCENLHYESVYFKVLHNEQEYYWATMYRTGAAVVSTITSIMTRFIEVWNCGPPADVRLLNRQTSAGELWRSNQLFMAHLLGGDKFSHQLNSCTSTRFRFKLNYKLAALEVFLLNWNAFAFVASLKIYCTSRRVIFRTSCGEIFHCIFCWLVFIKH